MRNFKLTPVSVAAIGAVALLIFFLVTGGAVLLNYIITINAIHHQDAINAALNHKQQMAQIKSSAGICDAVSKMNDAGKGATNASSSPNSYGHRLAKAIGLLYDKSGCAAVLKKYGPVVGQ
jgi:hypothetical protein